jgi:hypothetical protein
MDISLGLNLQTGPWGGGNQFGQSLYAFLQKKNVDVSFDLKNRNLDIIVMVEPRITLKISAFNHIDILRYRLYKNKDAVVVHRINECDERKGTHDVNKLITHANTVADFSVYVSGWLQDLYRKLGLISPNARVILNGANKDIFNSLGYKPWERKNKLRLVTHHWGANYLKGFDIYEKFDQLLASPNYSNKFEFMYIGNLPKMLPFLHTNCVEAKYGVELASSIRSNHVYLTASQNEPGANHPSEGALCGLPIIYRPSGSLSEYCQGYGIEFSSDNFESKLNEMYDTYENYVNKMENYPFNSDRMCQQYYELFVELLDRREELINQRKKRNSMVLYLESLLPYNLIQKMRGKFKQWIT